MAAVPATNTPFVRSFWLDNNGNKLNGGLLFTYAAGTTTKQNTYTDSSTGTANPNPVVLDANGRADVFLDPTLAPYKFVLSPSTDTDPPTNAIWTEDNVWPAFNGGVPLALTSQAINETSLTLSSAATVNIGAAKANYIFISGVTTITAFDTVQSGVERTLEFQGALTLTYNATSLILPTKANILTVAGDVAKFRSEGSGNWRCVSYQRASGDPIIDGNVTLASAGTVNIGAASASYIFISGVVTITAFDTVASGIERTLEFQGVLTLTNNATSLILPRGQNITTAAGDTAIFRSEGSGNWRCINYSPASGFPIRGGVAQVVNVETGAVATGTTAFAISDAIPQNTAGDQYMSLAITPINANSILLIDVVWIGTNSTGGGTAVALFQDATANALAAAVNAAMNTGAVGLVNFRHKMTAGQTTSTTFKVRAGNTTGATTTFNGTAGGRQFGGVFPSSITITEILP